MRASGMSPPSIEKQGDLPDAPVLGYPSAVHEQQPLVASKLREQAVDETEFCGPWGSCATALGFVAFAVLVVVVIPTALNFFSGNTDPPFCSRGCITDPWAVKRAGVPVLANNRTRFSDPAWQKQQASKLLSAWGFASGKRFFIATAGKLLACSAGFGCLGASEESTHAG